MTPEPVPERPAARAGWLLRLGVRAAISAVLPLLALAGVLAAAQTVQRMLWPALFLADPKLRLDETLLVGGAGCLGLAVARPGRGDRPRRPGRRGAAPDRAQQTLCHPPLPACEASPGPSRR